LAEGNTVAEAIENLEDGAVVLLGLHKRHGLPLPEGLEEFKHSKVLEAQLVIPLPE
jgi:predicted RNase H-like HicB family nuclease